MELKVAIAVAERISARLWMRNLFLVYYWGKRERAPPVVPSLQFWLKPVQISSFMCIDAVVIELHGLTHEKKKRKRRRNGQNAKTAMIWTQNSSTLTCSMLWNHLKYGGNIQKTIAIPIYRVLEYPVIPLLLWSPRKLLNQSSCTCVAFPVTAETSTLYVDNVQTY